MDRSKFGTKAALLFVINEICPNSKVEEWYEYNGDRYHFRIVLSALSRVPLNTLLRVVDAVRPVRSILDKIDIKTETIIELQEQSGYVLFAAPVTGETKTGTIPREAVSGVVRGGNINLGTMGDAAAYHARACGTSPGSLI